MSCPRQDSFWTLIFNLFAKTVFFHTVQSKKSTSSKYSATFRAVDLDFLYHNTLTVAMVLSYCFVFIWGSLHTCYFL